MTDMIERVASAIEKAQKVRSYGLYDYSGYPGNEPPHVVRDERSGNAVFRSNDPNEAEAEYTRLCRDFIGRAAVEAMREPTQAMLDEVCSDYHGATIHARDDVMRKVWGEMIDAALSHHREAQGGE